MRAREETARAAMIAIVALAVLVAYVLRPTDTLAGALMVLVPAVADSAAYAFRRREVKP